MVVRLIWGQGAVGSSPTVRTNLSMRDLHFPLETQRERCKRIQSTFKAQIKGRPKKLGPPMLPLPGPEILTLYTDISWHGSGMYRWAFVISHYCKFEEVWGNDHGAENNTEAEILAACYAIEEVNPPKGFCLVFDSMGIGDTAIGKARIRTKAQARLKGLVDDLTPLLRWYPGHGKKTPYYLKRCDVLAGGGE